MRKSVFGIAITLVVVSALSWSTRVSAEEDMVVPMGEIVLESIAKEAQRSAVAFPHALHFDYNCQQCHHTWDKTTPIVGCATSGCHDLAEIPKGDDGRPVSDPKIQGKYYKNAYHAMCIGCHKSIKAKNKAAEASKLAMGEKLSPTGPTGCVECHPQE